MPTRIPAVFALSIAYTSSVLAAYQPVQSDFWDAREVTIPAQLPMPAVRVGIWDSGVDLSLFETQLARGPDGKPLVRGYDSFKMRQDTPLAILPAELLRRKDELDSDLRAFDDVESEVKSEAATRINARIDAMSESARDAYLEDIGRWVGYTHGTGVADIALRGNGRAEVVVARMEWWHGSPPVPCWTRELADREAESIRDLLDFQIASGVRVVNMSWGRFETSYLNNLKACAPTMPEAERKALARYTVQKIRGVLQAGMASAPNVLFVGAAGNAGAALESENPATRFTLPNFILVGAVDANGALAAYSNKGDEISLYANGYRVPARLPGGKQGFPTGTSMATPNVANAAAKVLLVNPDLSGAELKDLLIATSEPNSTGQRLLNPRRAVDAARELKRKDIP